MVKYKSIVQAISDYVEKCGHTLAEMRKILSQMSSTEKYDSLKEQGLLNEGELKHYEYLREDIRELPNIIKEAEDHIDEVSNEMLKGMFKDTIRYHKQLLKEESEEMFHFEKRLLNGYKPREAQEVDYDVSKYEVEGSYLDSEYIGKIEKRQIESQKDIKFEEEELDSLQVYYSDGARRLNSKIYNGTYWQSLPKEEKEALIPQFNKVEKHLSNAINKTEGLTQDTIIFHGGKFDLSKIVGDKINIKGYLSCSFQKGVAQQFNKDGAIPNTLVYTYELLLPKGYKGLCANDDSQGYLTNYREEHEFVLDKGFNGKIVDIDYESQTVTIVPV